ncbi:MAG: hypothetical protein IPO06_26010 [Leptospiraceae bacterium]|nr:hypothetical protein [Leptospiraceae bacterium]
MKSLQFLNLSGTSVSSLQPIAELSNLHSLILNDVAISDLTLIYNLKKSEDYPSRDLPFVT